MTNLTKLTQQEFSQRLGITEQLDSVTNTATPSPWGIARLIRREVRRQGLVTRRELRKAIEPFLVAAGYDTVANSAIRHVADQMVEIGEIRDLRLENQRGYSALPSRWIELNEDEAVLVGPTAAETYEFHPTHQNQYLRRFCPNDSLITHLEQIGVLKQPFSEWLGEPGWKRLIDVSREIDSLDKLLDWHLHKLETEGAPFSVAATRILAINPQPGSFFGLPWNPRGSRWTLPNRLVDGVYLGAQPGYSERQWHPVLLSLMDGQGKSLMLNSNNNTEDVHDLRNWLLLAIGSRQSKAEQIQVHHHKSELQCTFPVPHQISRCLKLVGEETETWRYSVLNSRSVSRILSAFFPEIEFSEK